MPNANFDNILTTTLDKHRPALVDAIFTARPLTFWLMKAGNIEMVSGGEKIVEPLVYAENGNVMSYSGDDILDTSDTEMISASEWEWKQVAASVRITGLDEAKNSGPEAIINLLQSKVMVTEESMKAYFNRMFHAASPGAKDFHSLPQIITPVTGTIGGINAGTYAYWRPAYVDNTAEALGKAKMTTAFNSAAQGNDAPDLILTDQTLFEKYEALLEPDIRYSDTMEADGAFQTLRFKGRPIVFDDDCASGVMYFLNSKYIKLKGHSSRWFTSTPFDRPPNQDLRTAQILAYGNLVVNNRRMHSVLTAKT